MATAELVDRVVVGLLHPGPRQPPREARVLLHRATARNRTAAEQSRTHRQAYERQAVHDVEPVPLPLLPSRDEVVGKKRRVVACSEFEPGKLFADWTILVVHLPRNEKRSRVVHNYLQRGKSEQVNDVFKNELRGDLMSHHKMRHNQTRGLLTSIAQNLLVAFDEATRRRLRPRRPATIRAKLLLVATTLVRHARSLVLRLSAPGTRLKTFDRLARAVEAWRPLAAPAPA